MRINDAANSPTETTGKFPVRDGQGAQHRAAPAARVERADRVEISSEARALAAKLGIDGEKGALTAERIAELRQRIADGFYDDPAVANEVVRQLLDSGDLEG